MKHLPGRISGRWLGIVALATLLQACATLAPPANPEDIVRDRAKSRWDARLAGDLETAYSYASPAYRSAFDVNAFGEMYGRGLAHWTSAEVRSVTCRETVCDVVMFITYTTPVQKGRVLSSTLNERWVLEDDQWWIYLKV